jgi:hypothetical protein
MAQEVEARGHVIKGPSRIYAKDIDTMTVQDVRKLGMLVSSSQRLLSLMSRDIPADITSA